MPRPRIRRSQTNAATPVTTHSDARHQRASRPHRAAGGEPAHRAGRRSAWSPRRPSCRRSSPGRGSSSGTASWIVVLAVAAIPMAPKPTNSHRRPAPARRRGSTAAATSADARGRAAPSGDDHRPRAGRRTRSGARRPASRPRSRPSGSRSPWRRCGAPRRASAGMIDAEVHPERRRRGRSIDDRQQHEHRRAAGRSAGPRPASAPTSRTVAGRMSSGRRVEVLVAHHGVRRRSRRGS